MSIVLTNGASSSSGGVQRHDKQIPIVGYFIMGRLSNCLYILFYLCFSERKCEMAGGRRLVEKFEAGK